MFNQQWTLIEFVTVLGSKQLAPEVASPPKLKDS